MIGVDGGVSPAARRLADRTRLDLPTADVRPPPAAGPAGAGADGDDSPIAAVDHVLVDRTVRIFSPDEGASNRLDRCLAVGLVTEVLAEQGR